MSNIYQIKFHSRGGQGAKTATQILAEAAIDEGKFAQAFSEYGPERSGAPMKCFLRISNKPIRIHSEIQNPDLIIIVDPTLIDLAIKENEQNAKLLNSYIINTSESAEKLKLKIENKDLKIYAFDATKIALDKLGKNIPNMPITGAVVGLSKIVLLDSVIERLKERFEKKLGAELTQKNVEALKQGYQEIKNKNFN